MHDKDLLIDRTVALQIFSTFRLCRTSSQDHLAYEDANCHEMEQALPAIELLTIKLHGAAFHELDCRETTDMCLSLSDMLSISPTLTTAPRVAIIRGLIESAY